MTRLFRLIVVTALFCGVLPPCSRAQVTAAQIAAHPPTPQLQPGQATGMEVRFISRDHKLRGVLYMPPGSAPVPAMIFNHGADKDPNPQPELAAFYNKHGYAFFVPYRAGHGGSAGQTVNELLAPHLAADMGDAAEDAKFVRLLEDAAADTAAALKWLDDQPRIRKDQVFMSGISYGSLECLIDADTLAGIRGYVVFSGAARLFPNKPLAERLETAVKRSKAPILLIQAQNDYSTTPVRVLGPMLYARHDGSRAKLYPAFGDPKSVPMGHIAFSTWNLGTEIWGAEALAFMRRAVETNSR